MTRDAADRTDPIATWPRRPWRDIEDCLAQTAAFPRAARAAASAELIAAAQRERQAPAAALQATARLADGALAVITGQQPAFGGGPLYTLIKTAHALALAGQLRDRGVDVVTVFWCASEDHDLGEAGHADLIERDGRIRRIHADLHAGPSLRHQDAGRDWPTLERSLAALRLGELGAEWLRGQAPAAGEGYGRWLCRLFETAFADHGLIALEAATLRPAMREGFAAALAAWPREALAAQAKAMASAGLARPLGDLAEPPLFRDDSTARRPLDPAAARSLLDRDVELLSPGAALRPILQQQALPGLAYVAGPGEIAYHAQLAPLYDALSLPAPILVPRMALTLVPPHVRRGLARWNLEPDALPARGSLPAAPPTSDQAIAARLERLDDVLNELAADPDRRVVGAHHRLRRERDRLADSLAREARQAAELPALGHLRDWLHPRGGPQERSLSLSQALWCWGPGLAAEAVTLASATAPGEHRFLSL